MAEVRNPLHARLIRKRTSRDAASVEGVSVLDHGCITVVASAKDEAVGTA